MSELVFNRVILERNNRTLMILSSISLVLNFVLVLGLMRASQRPPLLVYVKDGEITVLKTKSLSDNETLLKDFIRLIAGQYLSFSINSLPKQIDAIRPYLGPNSIQNILQSYKDNQPIIQRENISQQFIVNTLTITKKSNPFWVEVEGLQNIHAADNDKSSSKTYIFEVTKVRPTQENPYGFLMTDVIEKDKPLTKGRELMKIILLIAFMLMPGQLWADQDSRYLQANKVFYETPLEEDVLRVHLALGYCTVLQFPEKPILVTVENNSLVQVEIPKNSKNVVIKPLQDTGETNIFIFTPNQRFNYNVVIGDPKRVDYVVDSKAFNRMDKKAKNHLSVEKLIKMAREYDFLKRHNAVNEREFTRKNISAQYSFPKFRVNLLEAYSYKDPNYLVLHITVSNLTDDEFLNLTEQNTDILVNGRKFIPQYVLFDSDELVPHNTTDGWLILENSFVSLDNKFSLSLGVNNGQYVCKQSVS